MRKMTIFRSSALACVAAAAMLVPRGAAGQQATSHVVVEGETLWAIAANYFGDPFLWPEIYRLNTDVVEDPHWIFPGEQLRLMPMPEPEVQRDIEPAPEPEVQEESIVRVAPPELAGAAPPPPPPSQMGPTIFVRSERGTAISTDVGRIEPRPVSRGTFYAAGFLTEGDELPWGRITGIVGRATIRRVRESSSAMVYQEVEVEPPLGGSYAVGDSLLAAQTGGAVQGWGHIVRPSGLLVVRRAGENGRVIAQLVQQYNSVSDGSTVLPLEPFRDPGRVAPVPTDIALTGTVVASRDENPLPGQQRVVFLDVGRTDGVSLGDVFVMEAPDPSGAEMRIVGTLQVVHLRENSSSGIVMSIRDLGVGTGAAVRIVRKMPS
jgi:hypothetical protein